MSPSLPPRDAFFHIVKGAAELTRVIHVLDADSRAHLKNDIPSKLSVQALETLRALSTELTSLVADMSPAVAGRIQISLGRSGAIAKFFAHSFIAQPLRKMSNLDTERFLGSGVYGIYYVGAGEPAYQEISGTVTPIYIGKADPKKPYAETTVEQGPSLHFRLGEHARSIAKGSLNLGDFRYRCATIQSGMQAAVEDFLIRLFHPIWNKEVKVCYGIGKHGDSSETRKNKRSPWDTMHPGRKWALSTTDDQMARDEIVENIQKHFEANPPFKTLEALQRALLLD